MLFNNQRFLLSAFAIGACLSTASLAEEPVARDQAVKKDSQPAKIKPPKSSPFLRTTHSQIRLGFRGLFAEDFAEITPHPDSDRGTDEDTDRDVAHGVKPFLGAGVFFEVPLHRLIVVGALFDALFNTKGDIVHFNIDALIKVPFAIGTNPLTDDFYLALPAGVTLGHFFNPSVAPRSMLQGGNAGLLLGKGFTFLERYSVFAEVGYRLSFLDGQFEQGTPYSYFAHSLATALGASIAW